MTNSEMMSIIDGIRVFPIGEIAPDRKTLLCKAEIVSYLAQFEEQFGSLKELGENVELVVKNFLGKVISLKNGEVIPTIEIARQFLNLPLDLFHNFSNIKYIKDRHPEFSSLYSMIALHLVKERKLDSQKAYN